MQKITILILLLLTTCSFAVIKNVPDYFNNSGEHYHWQGDPLLIELPLNQEKRIVFDEPVSVDVQGKLTTTQLRLLNNNQSLYLTALNDFPKTRINVKLQNSQQVIFLDLITAKQASTATDYISSQQSQVTLTKNNNSNDSETYVTLLRYAWQQFYAPTRLIKLKSNITHASLNTLFFNPYLIQNNNISARPIIAWQYQHTFITVLELRNQGQKAITLHLNQDICGQWIAATLYPYTKLLPQNSTLLFLISQQPFYHSLEGCHA